MASKNEEERYSTIPLREVKKMLGYSGAGFRSVLSWCKKNQITVIGIGRRKRILESDWIRVQEFQLVKALRKQFPHTWEAELGKRGLSIIQPNAGGSYEPKSDLSRNFMTEGEDE